LPELNVSLLPEEKGVDSLARQIRMTGRAYPLFDIAQLILQKPERHAVQFQIKKNAEGQPIQPLFLCALDDTLWLSEDEAVAHVLQKHFATFYQAERTATEPPKGKYTFVAQCGISGVILGPPNHHDYQNQLRRLHADRFSRMPFDMYKARVRIVRDEETVKKWVDDQSWKTEYICLNMPEPLRLGTMEAVQQHFRENHKDTIIKPVESHRLSGTAARNLRSPELVRMVRTIIEDQKRFPLQIATVLSTQFAGHGLHFFKVNKTITHVSVARPTYLDLEKSPVSEGVRKIVDFINAHPKCTRRQLFEALVPTPAQIKLPPVAPVAPAPAPAPVEAAPAPAEGAPAAEEAAAPTPAPAPAPAAPAPAPEPSPEQTAVISDLHWLVHQGHVIEFANGTLETAKKPVPKPPKPPKAAPAAPAEGQPAATAEAAAAATPAEAAPAEGVSAETAATPAPEATVETVEVPPAPAPEVPATAEPAPQAPAPAAAAEAAPASEPTPDADAPKP
jgi:hypothetical protein